jgi:predicted nucleotidyltransferase
VTAVVTTRLNLPLPALADLCRRHQIRRLSLFGSALRDDFGPNSDIDLLVEFEPEAQVGLRFFAIERELTDLLGRPVDLNTAGFLHRDFRDTVLAEAQVIYESA